MIQVVSLQANTDVLYESEETLLTFIFTLSEPPPPQGVTVTLNGDVAQNLNQLDLFNITVEGGEFPVPDFDNTGYSFTITSQTATLSAPIFIDNEPEDPVTVTYTLAAGNDYEVDPDDNQFSVTFVDEPPPAPVVSVQANTDVLYESEETLLTFIFTLSEPPPPEGVTVTLNGDVAQNLNQLDVFNITVEGGNFPVPNFDNTGYSFTITSQTATLSAPIFIDNEPEDPVTVTYTLAAGNDYEVDPDDNQFSVTFVDKPPPAPVVSVQANTDVLYESEETLLTFIFTLSEPPPPEGVTVTLNGDVAQNLNQLDVFNITVEGGNFPVPNFDNTGYSFTITSQTATLSAPIFIDNEPEDPVTVTYTLAAGNDYEVDPDDNQFSVTFVDKPPSAPVVSVQANTDVLYESEETLLTFIFTLSEPPPPEGVTVTLNGDVAQNLNQLDVFNITVEGGNFPVPNFDNTGYSFTITSQTATLSAPIFIDNEPEDPVTVTYTLAAGNDYEVDPNNNQFSVTFADNPPPVDNPLPIVSITANPTTLVEDEGTTTVITLTLSEPPPAEGIIVNLDSNVPFSLGDFDVFPPPPQATATGGRIVTGNQDNSGFEFRINSQTATITLPIFNDPDRDSNSPDATRNDDIGVEQITYFLVDGDTYDLNPNASQITLTLADTRSQLDEPPTDGTDDLLQVPVYRFYNPSTGNHFLTIDSTEKDNLLANSEWGYQYESISFEASSTPNDDLLPVFRFYNSIAKAHFFTTDIVERDNILANPEWQYTFEDIAFYTYGSDRNIASDVYRFYNPISQGHFFTANPDERDNILAHPEWQYTLEGVGFEAG